MRDFSLIFDTLTQFEEALVQHRLSQAADDEDEPEVAHANGPGDDGEDFLLKDDENDIDLRYMQDCSFVKLWVKGTLSPVSGFCTRQAVTLCMSTSALLC